MLNTIVKNSLYITTYSFFIFPIASTMPIKADVITSAGLMFHNITTRTIAGQRISPVGKLSFKRIA